MAGIGVPESDGELAGAAANDIWLLRDKSGISSGGNSATLEHFDGRCADRFIRVAFALTAISGSAEAGFCAVGEDGTILRLECGTWVQMPSPTGDHLYAVWGASSTEAWAVGAEGTILRFDGRSWSSVQSPTTSDLLSIHGGAHEVWIGGDLGTLLHLSR